MTVTLACPEDNDPLSYDRLDGEWRQWAQIARNFSYQLDDHWDREDLTHNIIVRLAEVAEEYHQQGKPLTNGGCIRVSPVHPPPLLSPEEKMETSVLTVRL